MNDHLERIRAWIQSRPILEAANRHPDTLLFLLKQEVEELERAIASEPVENQHREWLDIYWFVLSIAVLWEIDIDAVFSAKEARNSRKYPTEDFQEGNYDEVYARIKREWTGD